MAARTKSIVEQLIGALIESPVGCDVIFCRDKKGFSLDMMTVDEERRFREALAATSIQVVSFPLGSKQRFADLFGKGTRIISLQNKLFIPVGIFEKQWYKNEKATENVLVL